jgi:hypothetical protein
MRIKMLRNRAAEGRHYGKGGEFTDRADVRSPEYINSHDAVYFVRCGWATEITAPDPAPEKPKPKPRSRRKKKAE